MSAAQSATPPKVTSSVDIVDWRPEDNAFWETTGKRVANRNLWISVPSLLCGFAVWVMWGIITVQMQNLGFAFTQPELIGLTLCDLGTLKCEPVVVPVGESNRFDWLLTDDAIWYRTATTPYELVRFDLARRAIDWRSAFAPTAFGLAFAVRPDGRALLVAREEPPTIDLMYAPRGPR